MPTALITGANRGLGRELVRSFAADGWTVHAGCRLPDKAARLRAVAGEVPGQVVIHRLDVTDDLQVRALARSLEGEPLDLLLNNAGVYGPREGFGEQSYEVWAKVMAVNVLGPMRMVESFVDLLAASERRLIVNMSSRLGSITDNAGGGSYPYRSSKAALNMLTRNLAADLAEQGISVVALHPGWVQTDMGGKAAPLSVEESVSGLRRVIDGLAFEDSGCFLDEGGAELPW